jgi:hypothetical protein
MMSVGVCVKAHAHTHTYTQREYVTATTHSAYRERVFSLTEGTLVCERQNKMNVTHRVLCGDYTSPPFSEIFNNM